jgi:hypothetical protein
MLVFFNKFLKSDTNILTLFLKKSEYAFYKSLYVVFLRFQFVRKIGFNLGQQYSKSLIFKTLPRLIDIGTSF